MPTQLLEATGSRLEASAWDNRGMDGHRPETLRGPSAGEIEGAVDACPVPHADLARSREQEASELSALLSRVASGDQGAFADLYDHTCDRVYGLALRVVRSPGMAEDVTQEVFLQVWRLASEYDSGRGSPIGWLITLAHRRAVDRVRSESSRTARESKYESSSHLAPHDVVFEQTSERLEAQAVTGCLETLSAVQQESVRLAYYGGHTYREVAERLGIALPTVKSRIRDGLIKLKACLGVASHA